ncbi:helix-turn-helix domain-containing protein [Nocardioides nitrophenolicus]|uniref:helix-turn-helix domain-containing protein n=1 Tax=Nocardioides nitrophenolicus TaxID=60489 RepID=UPI00195C8057|nr:helix-turn-helix domain-containing protein [Nocardioides nitrophenolicus]MBM7518542.1 transcriptional regulator with XRE-family HTH domain [Nocardioides nitrophenolicus]
MRTDPDAAPARSAGRSSTPTLLRSVRTGRGLRAADLAAEIGVHPMSILRWERRERLPGPAHIHALARVLDLDPTRVADFFDDARAAPPPPAAPGYRGCALRPLRWSAGVSAAAVARRAGVPVATVYNWEGGRARIPAHRIPPIAELLGVPHDDLVSALATPTPIASRPAAPAGPLRRLRHGSRLSQSRAARLAGVDRRSLGSWERGEARPSLAAVRRLARAYGVPVATVARAAGIEPPPLLDHRRWRPGDLPRVLRTLRAWAGLTQAEVARRCGCSSAAVRTWESGRTTPSARLTQRLEQTFGLRAGALDEIR